MFNNQGLSLDQAPPIKVVLRFFLTGSIFGLVFALMAFFFNKELFNISLPSTIATIHIFTLGVMASFMFGALFQMLPVICGVAIKTPVDISMRVNYVLIVGTIFLVVAFFNGSSILYIFATIFLSFAIFSAVAIMVYKLYKINHNNSSRGMLLALISLFIVAIVGFLLISMRAGANISLDYLHLKYIHFSFALFGWIAMLIISVSFQVIEMFYVTKPYNKYYAKYLPFAIFLLLFLNIIFNTKYLDYIVLILISIHSILTIYRLYNKKRALTDTTIIFWYIAMSSFLLFTISVILNLDIFYSAIFFILFALSVVFAMSYKIVPFLVWFHLNAKGYFDAPMMHEIAPNRYSKINLYIFLSSFITLLFAKINIYLLQLGAILLFGAFLMLFVMIYKAWHKYLFVLENGKRFDFNIN